MTLEDSQRSAIRDHIAVNRIAAAALLRDPCPLLPIMQVIYLPQCAGKRCLFTHPSSACVEHAHRPGVWSDETAREVRKRLPRISREAHSIAGRRNNMDRMSGLID